jgi:hypothetical protein
VGSGGVHVVLLCLLLQLSSNTWGRFLEHAAGSDRGLA